MTPRVLGLTLAAAAFVLAATANSGGYRYGVSDQAFYAAAVVKDLHPAFYPHDTPLLDVQSHLMWSDEIVAGLVRGTGVDQPTLYVVLYVCTLALLFAAAVAFGRAAGLSWWAVAALLVLLTFRHRIAKTGANSLEGYMHPRMLAFAFGAFALAAVMAGRRLAAVAATTLAACWHPTTAVWFGIPAAVAIVGARPDWRRWALPALGAAAAAGLWLTLWGPLAGRLVVMDPDWLAVLASKDYLFPHQWPLYAWVANLAYPAVVIAIFRRRRRTGVLAPGERGLVAGLAMLAVVFLLSLPFTVFRVALAVQMQVTRVFWVLDFAAAAYLAWWLIDDRLAGRRLARATVVGLLVLGSIGRGAYLLSQDRRLFAATLPATPWVDAMDWLKAMPASTYVLADPGHAWKYGVSVRLAAEKDTLLEAGKDTALAIYDRGIAMAVGERIDALAGFEGFTTADARRVAERYGLDVAVREASHPLELRELYRNRQFIIYRLR